MSRRGASARRLAPAATALAGLLAFGGCGGGDGDQARTGPDPFAQISQQTTTPAKPRAAPRWQRLARIKGTSPRTQSIWIAAGAIQWRARWRCTRGRIALTLKPTPKSAAENTTGRCPASAEATWVQTGEQRLRIDARGTWSVVLEQQIDSPIDEPVLAAMRAPGTQRLAGGSFYDVEREGRGRARLYRLADGRGALRLAPFTTSANTDLFVWLSTARRPRTSEQATRARRLGPLIALKATTGPQNYVLPAGVDPRKVRSVVIWCRPARIVYTVASLRP